ncbi:hypothetical protein L798_13228 [Zootermopsis nevadensis]|uniref:Uncharacterized protein n=1 Tax=Zootermopsis nevadensis TaxID=136037 RepID=A0A067QVB9_ZOONE|nr:hypothetical protein L798_13228 [Zootermopsis nevadensis]
MLSALAVTFHPLTNYSSPFCLALCVYDESGSGFRYHEKQKTEDVDIRWNCRQ